MKTKARNTWRAVSASLILGATLLFASTSAFAHGCTPGYWKVEQHYDSWVPTGYEPTDNLLDVFGPNAFDDTLLEGLNYPGGPGVDGAKMILLRAAVAALLNATHPGIDYGPDEAQVLAQTAQRLAGVGLTAAEHRTYMLALASAYDTLNNLATCPLN